MWGLTCREDERDTEDALGETFDATAIEAPVSGQFTFPNPPLGLQPKGFVNAHFGPDSSAKSLQFRKGTTTLAFVYEPLTEKDVGGIIVAVDSRASAGEYISSKSVMKILDVSEHMVATMAGGAADCQFWCRTVNKYCNLFELRERSTITVSAASKYFANVLYGYKGQGLSVVCSVGSGSLNAYGILDTYYKPKMSDEEAMSLGRRAIMHATYRDAGSGGVCNLVHITPTKKIRYPGVDVSKLWYEFADEIGRDIAYNPRDD
uniref:Pbs-5 n=1 Tax=Pristionchus pacificus TaxID=54126 RepID=A0A2A6BL20_PRIPA|eukprot:PDM66614.1 pbs-5 [Pristionchus pacificus]